jgi:hypothetical protein
MTTEYLHKNVLETLKVGAFLSEDCEPVLLAAISNYLSELTPSHSLNSRKFSLISLIKKHLDEPIDKFWKHYFFEFTPPFLSDIAIELTPDIELANLVRSVEWEELLPHDDFNHELFYPTVDAIRYTLSSFQFYISKDIKALQFEVDTKSKLTDLQKVRAKIKNTSKNDKLPFYLIRIHKSRCELCNQLTENYRELKRILRYESLGQEDKELVKNNMLQTPNFSSNFCVNHNPDQDLPSYKRALRRRDYFHGFNRLFIEARRCQRLRPYRYTYVLRVAYEISNGNSIPLKTRKAVLNVLREYFNKPKNERDEINSKLIALAYDVLNLHNSKNRDNQFIDFFGRITRL